MVSTEKAPTRPAMRGETEPGLVLKTEGNCSMDESTRPWDDCTMTVQYLGPAEVAAYVTRELGGDIAPATVRQYASKGMMPEPDVRIGPNAGWSEDTIATWWANRPGRGARTDLAGSKGK